MPYDDLSVAVGVLCSVVFMQDAYTADTEFQKCPKKMSVN